jgi:tRNA A37 threonylcarbamoyladenosine biosynthesis protein TsaE
MVRQHECRNDLGITTLHHCDVYRINSADEVMDLSLGELVEEQGIALVEWGELAASVFGRNVLTIDFVIDDNDGRMLTVSGDASQGREEALAEWSSL